MSDLTEEIKLRHGWDRFKDAIFIVAALVLTAVSIGSVTSKAAGKVTDHTWNLTYADDSGNPISSEIVR